MKKHAIRCKGIRKTYGEGDAKTEALKGIDLDISTGQLTLLVGPSGSGKTTLLSVITSVLTPDEGELFILDQDVHRMSDDQRSHFCSKNLGIVFQSLFLIPTLTVEENVALPLIVAGKTETQAHGKAQELLERFKIGKYSAVSPSCLSKGQQQRVAIARALIHDPSIIICDEPTSALDHAHGMTVMSILHELSSNDSKAVLVVTHDQRTFAYADRIINMDDGLITEGLHHE